VFALAIEFTILRFRTLKSDRNPVLIAVLLSLTLLPALVGLAWLLPGLLSGDMFAGREFTLVERLLTEARVLILYMSWTLAPYPGSLSFYHDDLQISSGLLSPWTTGVSIMVLLALAALALACARRYPLISLGLIWFFAAHALTATVIPLELVFEHRNYFASIGLLLAIIPLILDWLQRQKLRLVTVTFFGVLLCWFGSVTAMRSHEWSDPVRLANSEAMIHPQSPRANYELGRILVAVSDYDASSPLLQQARAQFIISMQLPGASILPEQGLILIAGNTGQPTDPAWWQSITSKLSRKAPGAEDTSAIEKILHCQMERRCPLEIERTLDMFMAALQHSSINPRILVSYAQFAAFILGDMELAERVAHEAINHSGGLYHIRQALEPVFAITKSQSRPVTAPGQQ
jgi:protein O-mannosyl-transferase